MKTRQQMATAAAEKLERLSVAPIELHALAGFDGFVDSIIHMVDVRHDMSPQGYERLKTITRFAERCANAAGKSTNIEQVLIEDRFGGNGPLMAGGLARLGLKVTYVGAIGDGTPEPVFAPFASRLHECHAIGSPSTTDCLEFEDGKLMFNNTANVQAMTWARVKERVGLDRFVQLVDRSDLLGIVNWSLLGGVPSIWRGLQAEVWSRVSKRPRRLFVDLSDPAKRTDVDIAECVRTLGDLQKLDGLKVTLGLNLAESDRISAVCGAGAESAKTLEHMATRANALRRVLGLDCVVIHPREGAAGADASGSVSWFEGPFTANPKLSTGAGDHFNAGFAFAQTMGFELDECLAAACGVSGAYVRDAESPGCARVAALLREACR
jgi:sugar/nucleoside kinase (ribokinase family)